MKNLSMTLILLSSLMFGSTAFAKTNNKNKSKTTTVKTTKRVIKNVQPNTKVTKTKVTKKYTPKAPVSRHVVGRSYSKLPGKAVKVTRKGRIAFYVQGAFFRAVVQNGRKVYVVVS